MKTSTYLFLIFSSVIISCNKSETFSNDKIYNEIENNGKIYITNQASKYSDIEKMKNLTLIKIDTITQKKLAKNYLSYLNKTFFKSFHLFIIVFIDFSSLYFNSKICLNLLNLNYQDIEYVNSTMENEIMKDVINIEQERISDNLIIKMNYFYSKKAISDIIAEKVFILTTSYSLSINLKNNKK